MAIESSVACIERRTQDTTATVEPSNQLPLIWSVRVWTRDPAKLYGIVFASCVGALIGLFLFHHWFFALIGFAAVAGSTAEFWAPQKYKIAENGATARCGFSVSAIAWSDVKRAISDEEGVKLSPLEKDGKLSPFRGVYLRFGDRREEVLSAIEQRWGPVV